MKATCCLSPIQNGLCGPDARNSHPESDLQRPGPNYAPALQPRPAVYRPEGGNLSEEHRIADLSYWGPELEFYIFNDVRYDQNAQSGYYFIDSNEAIWNTGQQEGPNLGYKLRHKEGYFPVPPADTLQDLRSEIILKLKDVGVHVEVHHHEVGTAGQGEIDMRYTPLTKMADNVMYYKYIIRNVAQKARQDGHVHAQADLRR